MNNCKICNSELLEKEQILRARVKDLDGNRLADIITYKTCCLVCGVNFRKTVQGKEESEWEVYIITS